MKTLYAACLARLGLSQAEAAQLHSARLDSVKSWSQGRRNPPDGAWADLRRYEIQIVDRAEAMRETWEDAGELRDVTIVTDGSAVDLMAAADFLLSMDVQPPLRVSLEVDPHADLGPQFVD